MKVFTASAERAVLLIVVICLSPTAFANHGVGTAGGGATTTSAVTLRERTFSVGIRSEYTEFEDISNSRLLELGEKTGDFDVVDRTFFYSTEIAYGVTDDFTLGLSIGWFEPTNFRVAEFEEGEDEVEKLSGNPEGITDLWLSGKYRVYRGPQGHVSFLAGVKFPTGRDDAELENDEQIEAVEQAGSGSYDFAIGMAYTRWLMERLTMDTNVQYILRTEGDRDFKIGDRVDANVAVGYPLTPIKKYPNYSVTGELNLRHLLKDEIRGNREENSGGTTLFLAPGVRAGITKRLSAFLSVPVPVLQHVNGEQQRTAFKVIFGVGYAF
ncbi:MAG: transporter [Candidatus Brocadiales bacterium]